MVTFLLLEPMPTSKVYADKDLEFAQIIRLNHLKFLLQMIEWLTYSDFPAYVYACTIENMFCGFQEKAYIMVVLSQIHVPDRYI